MRSALVLLAFAACGGQAGVPQSDDSEGKGDDFEELEAAGEVKILGERLVDVTTSAPDGTIRETRASATRIAARPGDTVTVRWRDDDPGQIHLTSFVEVEPGDELRIAPFDQEAPYHLDPSEEHPVNLELHVPEDADGVEVWCSERNQVQRLGGVPILRYLTGWEVDCLSPSGSLAFVARVQRGREVTWMWQKDVPTTADKVVFDMPRQPGQPVEAEIVYLDDDFVELSSRTYPMFDDRKRSSVRTSIRAPGTSTSLVPSGLADEAVIRVEALDPSLEKTIVETRFSLGERPRIDLGPAVPMRSEGAGSVTVTASGLAIARQLKQENVPLDGTISQLTIVRDGAVLTDWNVISPRPSFVLPALPALGPIAVEEVSVQGMVYEGTPWRSYRGFRRNPTLRPSGDYSFRAVQLQYVTH